MSNEVDKSLLDRLQALRGSSLASGRPAPAEIDIDVIERRKTPTGDDKLKDRLKSLRDGTSTSAKSPVEPDRATVRRSDRMTEASTSDHLSEKLKRLRKTGDGGRASTTTSGAEEHAMESSADIDTNVFQTSDNDLEELLRDVPAEESFAAHHQEPDDAQVRALLEQLSDAIPKDEQREDDQGQKTHNDDDDSDGEHMQKEVDSVIARFRDELELEKTLNRSPSPEPPEPQGQDEESDEQGPPPPDVTLPEVPSDPNTSTANDAPSSIDDITARLSALRAPSEDLSLPSVPTNKPAKGPKRLESRTNYTDDDVDSWCTVCLADATLLCLGCEEKGEPYCARCWREMHVGPAAAFDDRSHKAVQFGKRHKKEKKVALGA